MKGASPYHLLLELTRTERADEAFVVPEGPVDYVLRTEGGGAESITVTWSPSLFADLDAVRRPGCDPAVVQRIGNTLRKILAPAGFARHEEAILAACAEGTPVAVTVRSNAAELYALPWELLTLKSTGQHLGALPEVRLRYAWPETTTRPEEPSPRPEGGRILFAWSAAAGAVPAREQLGILRSAAERGHVSFDPGRDVVDHLSLRRLESALQRASSGGESVAVLHLLCHGGQVGGTYGLCWNADEEGGERVIVDAGRLREILAPHAGRIRLVVLSACDSGNAGAFGNHLGSVAQTLHQVGIQAVIASRFPLSVQGSLRFFEAFYEKLLVEPASVETALVTGRQRLLGEAGSLDWASLTLHARPEDGDDTRPIVFRPYRGLLAFQPAHRRFFFGREAEIEETLSDMAALRAAGKPRFMVVAGASGTGKSSMVLAGVVPRLLGQGKERSEAEEAETIKRAVERLSQLIDRKLSGTAAQQALSVLKNEVEAMTTVTGAAWEVSIFRPGHAPLAALEAALATRRDPARPFLLVVDQLEEIFTHVKDAAARQAFVARLYRLCEGEGDVHCITSIRVDFIGECGQVVLDEATGLRLDRVAYDEAHRVFVAQMGAAQLRTVIEEPARKVGLSLQEGLASRMVAEVGAEPSALPLLQYVLDLLWQRREGRVLTAARYEELGGVFGALERMADGVVTDLGPEEKRVARGLFARLVHFGEGGAANTRRRMPLARLLPSDPERRARFEAVISRFIDARLLTRQDEGGQILLEIAHEALLRRWKRLLQWLDEDRVRVAELGKLERWAADFKAHGALLREAQLGYAKQLRDGAPEDLDEDMRAMIEASVRAEEQEAEEKLRKRKRERRWLQAGISAAVVVAVAMGVLSLAARTAERRALEQQANAELAKNSALEAQAKASAAREEALRQLRLAGSWTLFARNQPAGAASLLLGAEKPSSTDLADIQFLELAQRLLGAPIPKLTFCGHTDKLWRVAWDAEGKRFVTASEDGTARIWNANGQGKVIELSHKEPVMAAAFDRAGRRVLTASMDGVARIWALEGEKPTVQDELRHASPITAAAWSPDEARIATGAMDGEVSLWDVDTGSAVKPAKLGQGHGHMVLDVAWSPDGKRVVSASWDHKACLWSVDGGAPICFEGHAGPINAAQFSPDGTLIVTASQDGTARVWDAATRRELSVLRGHQAPINAATFHPSDATLVATASDDNTVRIWARGSSAPALGALVRPSSTEIAVLHGHDADVTSVAFSPSGDRLLTGSLDQTARVWSLDRLPRPVLGQGSGRFITSAFASQDLRHVLAETTEGTTELFALGAAEEGSTLLRNLSVEDVVVAAFRPDGTELLTSDADGNLKLWPLAGSAVPQASFHAASHEPATAIAWSPDGARFVTIDAGDDIHVWDVKNPGAPPVKLNVLAESPTVAAWSPRPVERPLAVGHKDGTVALLSEDGKASPLILSGHTRDIASVAFAPDGERVVTASDDRTARVFRMDRTSRVLLHPAPVLSAVFDAQGKYVLTRSGDNAVRVWDPDQPERPVFVLGGFEATVPIAAFDEHGGLVTIDARGLLQRWAMEPAGILAALTKANEDCPSAFLRRRYLGEDAATAEQQCLACAAARNHTFASCASPEDQTTQPAKDP